MVGDIKWLIEQRVLKAQVDGCSHSRVVRYQSFNITTEHCSWGDLNSWYYDGWETSFTVRQMTVEALSRKEVRQAGRGQGHCELGGGGGRLYDIRHIYTQVLPQWQESQGQAQVA